MGTPMGTPFLLAVLGVVCAAPGGAAQGSAAQGIIDTWHDYAPGVHWQYADDDGARCAVIEAPPDEPRRFWSIAAPLPTGKTPGDRASGADEAHPLPGTVFRLATDVKLDDVRDGAGAGLSINFFDAAGQRIHFTHTFAAPGLPGWLPLEVLGRAPEDAREARALLTVHGFGKATFRPVRWEVVPGANETASDGLPARVTLSGEPSHPLFGFGAEDDGWFYNAENAARGVDGQAVAIRERRLRHMRPSWTRMFFWYKDWNPTLDGETFTFESDNMQSHYRALEQYQALGTRVTGCGVEWTMRDKLDDPARVARAVGALLEHLIRDKGFTCIRDWTFTNEPNLSFVTQGYDFDHFIAMHNALHAEFGRRGLDIDLVGSDDGDSLAWFGACYRNETLRELSGVFASHVYLDPERVTHMTDFVKSRINLMDAVPMRPRPPFVLAEFGLADERTQPPDTNPYMREYGYALNAAAAIIDALNAGTAGVNIWCLQEVYYPGGQTPMEFGLWDFGGAWTIRPIYHAMAMFTRLTRAGDPIHPAHTDHPAVKAVRIGDTVFWVHLDATGRPVTFTAPGRRIGGVHAFTEASPADDEHPGEAVPLDARNGFTVPPRSFGYAELR